MEQKEVKKPTKKVETKKVVKKETTRVKKEEKKEPEIREVIVERKSGFNYAEVIVIIIISLIIGGMAGSLIYRTVRHEKTKTVVVDRKNLPTEFDEFIETYENILNNYYKDVDSKKLLEAGISGMLEYLGDDYSVYMNKDISDSFNEQVEGKYNGIGIEIISKEDNTIEVVRVFSDSPAEKAGVKTGDIIVSANGQDVKDKKTADVADMIKNSGKEKASLVLKRGEQEIKLTIPLDEVNIDSANSKVFEKNGKKIGYIELNIFASNTYTQFEKKLKELEKEKIDSLIIDVRANSGGYLSAVTDMASLFLEKGKVIYQLDTKGKIEKVTSSSNHGRKYPIVILMDKNSASASEILAAAMKESYGATLIGTETYGKGTVQTAYTLKSGATVKYTIQKWLTPNGNWIDKKGVTPDIKVELTDDYVKNPSDETDTQLQKALEELSK